MKGQPDNSLMEYFLEKSLPDWQGDSGKELDNGTMNDFLRQKNAGICRRLLVNHSSFSSSGRSPNRLLNRATRPSL